MKTDGNPNLTNVKEGKENQINTEVISNQEINNNKESDNELTTSESDN